jgi:hypothetical protein
MSVPEAEVKPAVARPASGPVNAVTPVVYPSNKPPMPQPAAPRDSQVVYVGGKTAQEWLTSLNQSGYPEIRELAVSNLAAFDWRANVQIVPSLLNAAFKDSTPAVRVACIRVLAKMDVNTAPVVEALRKLEADPNMSVRSEAYSARFKLTSGRVN